MISRKYGIFVSSNRVMPCHECQPTLLAYGRQAIAYVFMAVHAETLDLVHNLDSVIFSLLLVVPQVEPEDLLADRSEEVIIVILSTLGIEVFVGRTVCHVVRARGQNVVKNLCVRGLLGSEEPAALLLLIYNEWSAQPISVYPFPSEIFCEDSRLETGAKAVKVWVAGDLYDSLEI